MEQQSADRQYMDDEISLIDIWGVLIRRKTVLWSVFALCVALAIVAAVVKSEKYTFTTTIEIGSVTEENGRTSVEKPETVLAKVQEGYIPLVVSDYINNAEEDDAYELTARVPKNSALVVIETKAQEKDGAVVKQLENAVIEMVVKDHARITDVVRENLSGRLEKAKRGLVALREQQTVLETELERKEVLKGLLKEQLEEAKTLVNDALTSRKQARASKGDATHAMTLMMIDNEIKQNQDRVARLQERFFVELPASVDKLIKNIADIKREQENAANSIKQLSTALNNIQETRAISPPNQSLEPVGIARPLIVVLGAIIGLMLGMFAAFLAEFLAKAREQLKDQAA